ncbi:MAG: hypothetical protein ABL904_11315 [Hyphomicrobiaceae bacterium]
MRAPTRLTAMALLLSTTIAAAQAGIDWMGDDEIRKTFAGITINGVYIDGIRFTESYADGGGISYRDPRKAMSGRWSVINQSFCTLYDEHVTGGCFKVSRHSSNCYEFYFLAGTEVEAAKPEGARPSWTARGWDQAKPTTCDEKPAV